MDAAPAPFHDKLAGLKVAPGQVQRVDETGNGDDGRPVLVVVKDGNVHQFAQSLFDDEAIRRLDVFKIDAAERRTEIADAIDELIDILCVDFDVEAVHIGEPLEQDRFAFHHRLCGEGSPITQSEDGCAVRNHSDHVPFGGVIVGGVSVVGDLEYRYGNAGRVGQRQIPLRCHRLGGVDLQLSRLARW